MARVVTTFVALLLVLGVISGTSPAGAAEAVHGLKGEYFTTSAPEARDFANLAGTEFFVDAPGKVDKRLFGADRENAHLLGCQPEREIASVVLDEESHEAL